MLMDGIASRENPKLKEYGKLATSRKYREETGLFVVEGFKLLEEAAKNSVEIRRVFCEEQAVVGCLSILKDQPETPIFPLLGAAVEKISQSKSSQGVYAVCKMLDKRANLGKIDCDGSYLGLWNLQDPGNVGTMIRTADALGMSAVVLSEGCCDLYNLKTLRAAMGSLFRISVFVVSMDAFLSEQRGRLLSLAAVVDENAEAVTEVTLSGGFLVMIGNEGNGLSLEQAACCDRRVTIPMKGNAESLNAAMAATVLMWELQGRR